MLKVRETDVLVFYGFRSQVAVLAQVWVQIGGQLCCH